MTIKFVYSVANSDQDIKFTWIEERERVEFLRFITPMKLPHVILDEKKFFIFLVDKVT